MLAAALFSPAVLTPDFLVMPAILTSSSFIVHPLTSKFLSCPTTWIN